ncbi:MAG: hypothetical protein JSR17_08985 [Proteobacteria bacterium]|nr:hypothetical protein [Pseudomonadota bacterium]
MMHIPPKNAKVIPFPLQAPMQSAKKWGKRHFSRFGTFSETQVTTFIRHLLQNNTNIVLQMIQELGPHLATVHGNYFCPPLIIAAKNSNMILVNSLLEHGACAHMARNDIRFKYLPLKMKRYLKAITRFRQEILNQI